MSPRRVVRGVLYFTAFVLSLGFFGALLPREHVSMETVELPAPPEAVYAALRDVASAPKWRTGLERIEPLPKRGDREVYREHGSHGALTLEIVEDVPNKRFVTQVADIGLPFSGRWVFDLTPTESGGTRVLLAEIGDVPNPLIRFIVHYVRGYNSGVDQTAADLKKHLGAAKS